MRQCQGSAGCLTLGSLMQNSPEWFHSLSGCLLTACFVPGTGLGATDTIVSQAFLERARQWSVRTLPSVRVTGVHLTDVDAEVQ